MILKRPHISLITFHVHQFKVLTLSQRLVAIAHTVTLQISFSRHIESILVTKVIPTGIVRIVTGTNGIDVQLLHHLDVLNHALHRYHIAAVRVQLMTVGTLNQDSFSVDQQLSVLDFDMAETNTLANNFQHVFAFL